MPDQLLVIIWLYLARNMGQPVVKKLINNYSWNFALIGEEWGECEAGDGEGVRAEDEADLAEVEGVQVVVVAPLNLGYGHLEGWCEGKIKMGGNTPPQILHSSQGENKFR